MLEKGTIHITMMKNWVNVILFLRERGLIVYLAALKKGVWGNDSHEVLQRFQHIFL